MALFIKIHLGIALQACKSSACCVWCGGLCPTKTILLSPDNIHGSIKMTDPILCSSCSLFNKGFFYIFGYLVTMRSYSISHHRQDIAV